MNILALTYFAKIAIGTLIVFGLALVATGLGMLRMYFFNRKINDEFNHEQNLQG